MKHVASCDLCRGTEFDIVLPAHNRRIWGGQSVIIGIMLCRKCGFVFLNPRMDEHELKIFYATHHNTHHVRSFEELEKSPYAKLCRMQADLLIQSCGDRRGPALEIGAAEGYFLWLLSKNGFVPEGVEPCRIYRSFYKCHYPQIKMHWAMVEDTTLPSDYYTAITLRHILEHIDSPLALLRKVYKHLAPGGRVYIEVPNLNYPQIAICDYFHNQHLSYFTPQILRRACNLSGLTCKWLEEWNNNPVNSGGCYSVLRACAKKGGEPETLIKSDYIASRKAVDTYLKRRNDFLSQVLSPLRHRLIEWQRFDYRIALFGGGPTQ